MPINRSKLKHPLCNYREIAPLLTMHESLIIQLVTTSLFYSPGRRCAVRSKAGDRSGEENPCSPLSHFICEYLPCSRGDGSLILSQSHGATTTSRRSIRADHLIRGINSSLAEPSSNSDNSSEHSSVRLSKAHSGGAARAGEREARRAGYRRRSVAWPWLSTQ